MKPSQMFFDQGACDHDQDFYTNMFFSYFVAIIGISAYMHILFNKMIE